MSIAEDRSWFILGRLEEFEGEARANLLRIIAIGAFYIVELVNYEILGEVSRAFHEAATALAVTWTMVALGVQVCLRGQVFPSWLKYLSTGCDVALLSALLVIGSGPQSPMVVGYFLVVALAALRLQLRLIWCATIGSMIGYVFVLGATHPDWFGSPDRDFRVPRHYELITLVALALVGITLGQAIRRGRALAQKYIDRSGNRR